MSEAEINDGQFETVFQDHIVSFSEKWSLKQISISLLIALLIVKLTIFGWRLNKYAETMNKIPGPERHFLIGNLVLARGIYFSNTTFPKNIYLHQIIHAACKLSDVGMVKTWLLFRCFVLLFRADTIEPLLSSTVQIKKSDDYNFFKSWLKTGLLTSDGSKWKQRRKMLTPSFHFRILEEFQIVFSEQSQVLVEKLSRLPKMYSQNIMEEITLCTLDIIGETALGIKVDSQTNKGSTYVEALIYVSSCAMYRVIRPWLWKDFIFGLTAMGANYKRALKTLHQFTENVIRERKVEFVSERLDNLEQNEELNTSGKRRLAFLDMLLHEHFKDPSFTEKDIQEEVDTFTFEGHDTTSAGVSWCLYLLGLHPEIQERAYDELKGIFGSDKNTPITTDNLKEMKYIECVIKESQRLYPSVPIIGRKLSEDLMINGKLIPAETNCYVLPAVLHMNREVFPEPIKFDPERFTLKNSSGRHPYAYIPFSAGPRNCIGQKFAMYEEKTIIANIIRNFKVQSLDHRDKILICIELISRPYPYIRMQFEKR